MTKASKTKIKEALMLALAVGAGAVAGNKLISTQPIYFSGAAAVAGAGIAATQTGVAKLAGVAAIAAGVAGALPFLEEKVPSLAPEKETTTTIPVNGMGSLDMGYIDDGYPVDVDYTSNTYTSEDLVENPAILAM